MHCLPIVGSTLEVVLVIGQMIAHHGRVALRSVCTATGNLVAEHDAGTRELPRTWMLENIRPPFVLATGLMQQDIAQANEEIRRNTTPAYRSPEQVDLYQGHVVSEKVDIWALGVMLFKLAFFHTPFEDVRGKVEDSGILKGLSDRKVGVCNMEKACW